MTWFRCGGGGSGIPAALKNRMNAVLNKKFGTAVDYPPNGWPDDVNLLGELEEKTTAAASICSFSDGADDVPTKSLVVTITPTLSGKSEVTETQTGRNLAEECYMYSATNYVVNPVYLKVGAYTISFESALTSTIHVRKGDTVNLSGQTYVTKYNSNFFAFTADEDGYYYFQFYNSSEWGDTPPHSTQLELGSTAHAYEPYQTPTQYTANLGRTIYGGQADIVNGEGTDNGKKIKLNTLSWSYDNTSYSYGIFLIPSNISDMTGNLKFVCTNYINNGHPRNQLLDGEIGVFNLSNSNKRLVIRDDTCTTLEQFLTKIADYDLAYESTTDTPFTFDGQEINTRLGYNAFWSDSGDTEVTYRASGTMTPITPTLITKTITVNGSYQAADDQADGYSEVVVNVSGGSCERLLYLRCVNNDQIEIPAASSITQGAKYSQYVSYDSTTKKFTVLHDFTAIIIAWVYTYQTYESSRSDGALYINNSQVIQYEANGTAAGSTGGVYLARNFKQNDTFNVYTPTRDGYPQQNLKIYLMADIPDNIYTFTDENA